MHVFPSSESDLAPENVTKKNFRAHVAHASSFGIGRLALCAAPMKSSFRADHFTSISIWHLLF